MMQQSRLTQFKKYFEAQVQGCSTLSIQPQVDASGLSDDADRVTVLQEQTLSGTLQHRKIISIQSAEAALARIRMGSFGICAECGEDIDLKRLEAHPTTPFCIQCQEDHEHRVQLKPAI